MTKSYGYLWFHYLIIFSNLRCNIAYLPSPYLYSIRMKSTIKGILKVPLINWIPEINVFWGVLYLSIIAVIIWANHCFHYCGSGILFPLRPLKRQLSQNGMFYPTLPIPISSFWAKSIPISLTHYFTRLKDEYFYSTDMNSMSFLKDIGNLQQRTKFLRKNSFKVLCL